MLNLYLHITSTVVKVPIPWCIYLGAARCAAAFDQ